VNGADNWAAATVAANESLQNRAALWDAVQAAAATIGGEVETSTKKNTVVHTTPLKKKQKV
jgi:hypothetical protein